MASLKPLEFLVLLKPVACRVLVGRMGSAPLSVHRPSSLQALSNHWVEQNELVPAPDSCCSCSEVPAFQALLRSLGWELGPFRTMRVSGEQSRPPEPGAQGLGQRPFRGGLEAHPPTSAASGSR